MIRPATLTIVAALAAIILMSGCGGGGTSATAVVDAHDFVREFRDDPIAADKKYHGRDVRVRGTVYDVVPSRGEWPDVASMRPGVQCRMADGKKGPPVGGVATVRGRLYMSTVPVILEECTVE